MLNAGKLLAKELILVLSLMNGVRHTGVMVI